MTETTPTERPLKRSLTIAGHRTSVSLEHAFWQGLREIAEREGKSLNQLVRVIDAERGGTNLSSAIRLRVLEHYKAEASRHANAA